ncbi:MAG: DNA/pantothenate metabolism flavoprotein [Linnemannia elongata]|nr:MAG: DNA/pantothenate metabolism flavoprotein [Linnemannia elongata]
MASAQLNHPTPIKPSPLNGTHLSSDSHANGVNGQQHYVPSLPSGASTPASTASPGPVSAEVYFASHVAPKSLPENAEKIRTFVDRHMHEGRRVVLVTSGGTTVPLETQTVRFIDNFSAGTRGATSAEFFLEEGYAVIFMHRQFSLQPYSRHYSHTRNCFLEFMEADDEGIHVMPAYVDKMRTVLAKYRATQKAGTLLTLDFVTVNDYLFLLREAAQIISKMDVNAMYYLAAAVSDFFIPADKMSEHKIQSGDGLLNLSMDQVPKILKPLVNDWTPKAFIVSFKLETEEALLPIKSRQALKRYGHQIVIGNILTTRKRVVKMITVDSESEIRLTAEEDEVQHIEIESRIVPELIQRHTEWIEDCGTHGRCGIRIRTTPQ